MLSALIVFSIKLKVMAIENVIILKIDQEIITSLDIIIEKKYLKLLNPSVNNLDEETLNQVAKNSLIREKIKKIELQKNSSNFNINENYLYQLFENIYIRLNLNSISEFKNFLKKNNLQYEAVKNKIIIEALWNELIYLKFSDKVKINENILKENVLKKKREKSITYDLEEIVFSFKSKEEFLNKYKNIQYDIENKGFASAVLIHSESDTSKLSGKLGWISETSLSQKIKENFIGLKKGDYTKPIIIPGGALILKINDMKENELKIDYEKEMEKLIKSEKNRQLNQQSNIYYNKIKKNITFDEL